MNDYIAKGSIIYKTINKKKYAYHQWYENGRQHFKRVHDDELADLQAAIERGRKAESYSLPQSSYPGLLSDTAPHYFSCNVIAGEELVPFAAKVKDFAARDAFSQITAYLDGENDDKVLILYGLRRTGKTTLIRQAIMHLPKKELRRTAFLQVTDGVTLAAVNADLLALRRNKYKYVFIDEVTMLDDFIEGAALFSDVFASCGMKIVLSGTDSLGFIFTQSDQLYDRCHLIHTTYIPFREFSRVLHCGDIDQYIRYGGTMTASGKSYGPFVSMTKASEYVNSAIAKNVQHSLKNYQYAGHFRALEDIYEAGQLTNAINRVIEDINHRFTREVIVREFKSGDLALSSRNLRNDRKNPTDILDRIDIDKVTKKIMNALDIVNLSSHEALKISDTHAREIREYLELLDLTSSVRVIDMSDIGAGHERIIITQPGLRWAQAEALVRAVMSDKTILSIGASSRRYITGRILSEISGRMLEDIVLLDTMKSRPECSVFKLQFAVGEYDMAVVDETAGTCELYEIKHSDRRDKQQRRYLVDGEMLNKVQHYFGDITKRVVLYRGEDCCENEIEYKNVAAWLSTRTKISI